MEFKDHTIGELLDIESAVKAFLLEHDVVLGKLGLREVLYLRACAFIRSQPRGQIYAHAILGVVGAEHVHKTGVYKAMSKFEELGIFERIELNDGKAFPGQFRRVFVTTAFGSKLLNLLDHIGSREDVVVADEATFSS